jgi:hypothetical protein
MILIRFAGMTACNVVRNDKLERVGRGDLETFGPRPRSKKDPGMTLIRFAGMTAFNAARNDKKGERADFNWESSISGFNQTVTAAEFG